MILRVPLRWSFVAMLFLGWDLGIARAAEPAAAQKAAPSSNKLAGTWTFVGGEKETAALEEALKKTVEGMFASGIAADAVRGRAAPRPEYTLAFQKGSVTVSSPGDPDETGSLKGPAVETTNRFGDKSDTTFRMEKGKLVEKGTAKDGSGSSVFAPSADGKTMKVTRSIQSEKLHAPLQVTYTYKRKR